MHLYRILNHRTGLYLDLHGRWTDVGRLMTRDELETLRGADPELYPDDVEIERVAIRVLARFGFDEEIPNVAERADQARKALARYTSHAA